MTVAALLPKRCPRRSARLLWGLLGCLAALSALVFLAGGGHEELLSRSLPLLLRAGGAREPRSAAARPPLPAAAFFPLAPPACAPPAAAPGLLVLVASAPGHSARRAAVRRSWGGARAAAGLAVRTVFALGLPGEAALQEALEREAAEHGDLLQGRFADTYANLTLKTLALLGWAAARCPAARFLLKADDDVFLNLPALAGHLQALGGPDAVYLGRVHWHVPPTRDPRSRHYVPASLYPPTAYPPYCSGPAYVLSGLAAAAVLAAAPHLPLLPVEDVFVGLCARHAGITPRHLAHMAGGTHYPPDACCFREVLFSVHGVTPGRMLAMWAKGERPCSTWQRLLGLARCKALTWLVAAEEEQEGP
ncbi:beta-1,3-galactosyltransferase 4-like isoform X2 [Pantherophis guttatus]|nr:beta-1,3-galactosyltransferase 4-like isoform X2 [Pantherophis guttatus]XP_060546101.1 beta-1,3-galactosyltransferase 4-like isoform X2 [Pantherophis guttatus]